MTSLGSFNLSYADHLIAIAVSKTMDIGVDIEVRHEIPKDERPWHLFSKDEQERLSGLDDKDFPAIFFRMWTLKEAIAKRTGQGFATEFSDINTLDTIIHEGMEQRDGPTKYSIWLFHTSLEIDHHPLHLAVSASPTT